MPGQARIGDIGSGHASWPPTNIISGASRTLANGIACARIGDSLAPHASPSPNPAHPRTISMGSDNIIIEGSGAARIGDAVDCGGFIIQCSGNVVSN